MIPVIFYCLLFLDDHAAAKAHAKREATLMADRKVCEHILGPAKGARFSGVGTGNKPHPSTCVPWENGSSAKILIADEEVERDGIYYRSRHWK